MIYIKSFRQHQALGFTRPLTEISTADRNRTMFRGEERDRYVRLTTSIPSVDCLGNARSYLTSHYSIGLHHLLRDNITFLNTCPDTSLKIIKSVLNIFKEHHFFLFWVDYYILDLL
jgi:hypothetical protein